jgi:hypothetical protein
LASLGKKPDKLIVSDAVIPGIAALLDKYADKLEKKERGGGSV